MLDELRRMVMFTSGVAELSRNRAEQMVKRLVRSGEIGGDQSSSWVRNLIEASNENRKELARFVRSEIRAQAAGLGMASQRDVDRLERRVTRLETQLKELRQAQKAATARSKPAAAKKTATRKTPAAAQKTATRKTSARRAGPAQPARTAAVSPSDQVAPKAGPAPAPPS